jgi:YVTN family beta-propeller protein
VLLLHRNEVVSADRLIDALWDEAPPATAAKVLQIYVSRLRKALPGVPLLTRPPGYVLEVGDDELDADRLEHLLAGGRRTLAAGDPEQAARELREAVLLVRGQPLEEFAYERFAEPEIARLEELRLAVLEERVEADLELGKHAELVPELEILVAEHPLRERLRGLLMRSLYGSGRQAEALEAYADARLTLEHELGLEPSRALRELHRQVLEQDPVLEPRRPERPLTRLEAFVPEPLRRRSAALLLAGGAVLGAGLAAAAVEFPPTTTHRPLVPNRLLRIDLGNGRVTASAEVGATPTNVAAGPEGVWVVNGDDQTISLADPATARIRKTFSIGRTPTAVALGAGAAWVGDGTPTPQGAIGSTFTSAVSRIDLATQVVTRTVALPSSRPPLPAVAGAIPLSGVSRLAVGAGGVWAIDPDSTVARLDPATGRVVAVVPVVATNAIAAGAEGVWVIGLGPVLRRIDPRTNRAAQKITLAASGLADIALGAGSVWATDPSDGLVWRVQPGAPPVGRSIDVGTGATGIAFAGGDVWVTNFVDGSVLRIDPATNAVTDRIRVTGTPEGLGAAGGSLWVTASGETERGSLPSSACGVVETAPGSKPDVLIVSDLPLQGPQASVTGAMVASIRSLLAQRAYRAGRFTVGFQSCDSSTAQSGGEDFLKCASNVKAFAETPTLVGLIGPYTSDCARVTIPIAGRAAEPLAVVSPSNTNAGLTHRTPQTAPGEPARYFPAGTRNYFRVVASDDLQGAAQALLARRLGLRRVFVLTTGQTDYGRTLTTAFTRVAARERVGIAGTGTWANAAGYAAIAAAVARSRADGVLLADYDLHGGALIRVLRARLGRRTVLIAGDGFLPVPNVVAEAGGTATGMYVTFPGVVNGDPSGTYVPEAAEAAEVLLDAITRSDGTRLSVIRELARLRIGHGILGSFRFDRNGDMTPTPVGVVRVGRGGSLTGDLAQSSPYATISVPTALAERRGAGG